MSHRAAAITAAILAPFGVALAVPAVNQIAAVPTAMAGADNGDPNNPPPDQQPPPAQTTPTPPPTTPQPVPPVPQDTLQNDSSGNSNGGSKGDTKNSGSGEDESPANEENENSGSGGGSGNTSPQRLSVPASNTAVVSDTGAIPQGGVQAGGGGTAHRGRASRATEGLVLVVTGNRVLSHRHASK